MDAATNHLQFTTYLVCFHHETHEYDLKIQDKKSRRVKEKRREEKRREREEKEKKKKRNKNEIQMKLFSQ